MPLVLPPLGTAKASLTGFIVNRHGDADSTKSLGTLFSQFLGVKDSILQVTGVSVTSPAQPKTPVTWLTTAFRTLTLNVVLPGYVPRFHFS